MVFMLSFPQINNYLIIWLCEIISFNLDVSLSHENTGQIGKQTFIEVNI